MAEEKARKDWTDEKHRRIIDEQRRFLWSPEQLARLAGWLGLKPGMTMLDLGCGYGYVGRAYLPFISPGGRVVGVDRETPLVEEARRRAAEDGVGEAFAFTAGDACAVPVADESVDVAYCQTLLMHLAEPDRCLAELARVTKPGGLVVCNEPDQLGVTLGYNSAVPFEREEFLTDLRAGIIAYEGHKRRGLGDYAIGGRVPEMMHKLGLTDIDALINERVYLMVPPYGTPKQEHLKLRIKDGLERRDEWKEESRADFIAGGGAAEEFDALWARWERQGVETVAAMERNELFATNAGVFYVIQGRKPR